MKGCELFKAHGISQYGFDPIIKGINYARLGIDPNYLIQGYTTTYGEDFFLDFIRGYKNAFNEEFIKDLTVVIVPAIDIDFIMNNLIRNKELKDFTFGKVLFKDPDEKDGLYYTYSITLKHNKYNVEFTVDYHRNISSDSSYWSYWHIESKLNHRCGGVCEFSKCVKYTIDEVIWDENNYHQEYGRDGGSSSYWYERFSRSSYNSVPHSSNIAKLIVQATNNYVKRYKLDGDSFKSTLADIAKIKKQK